MKNRNVKVKDLNSTKQVLKPEELLKMRGGSAYTDQFRGGVHVWTVT